MRTGRRTIVFTTASVLFFGLAACVSSTGGSGEITSVVGGGGEPGANGGKYAKLALNENGLMPAIVTRIIDPVTVVVNPANPRTIKIAGIEPANAVQNPALAEEGKAWAFKYLGKGNVIYVRPLPGTDLDDDKATIVGAVLLPDESGKGYVDAGQGLLSQGLAIIKDMEEFDSPAVRRAAHQRQEEARRAQRGVWKTAK